MTAVLTEAADTATAMPTKADQIKVVVAAAMFLSEMLSMELES